jgi:D-arabinose 1-dehydrogenase-like Zn-dependent alcohol dehydrogenase
LAIPGTLLLDEHVGQRGEQLAAMRAIVLQAPNAPFELEERPVPRPRPDELLVRVRACGAGLTVHHAKLGNAPARLPVVPGHEIAGEVVEVGAAAEGFAVGDRVTPHFYLFCGRCRYCLTMREPLCEHTGGYVGRQVDGGYAEYVALPARNWIKIPAELPYAARPAEVAVICDAIATPYKVVRRAGIRPLEDVLVIGAGGGVGIHMVQLARYAGARVLAADRGEEKLAATREAGADATIDALAGPIARQARRLTQERGVDVAIDFVVSDETLRAGVDALAPNGRLVILGGRRGATLTVDPSTLLNRELAILGSRYVTRQDITDALELVRRGSVRPIVTRTFPLEDAELAHELLDRSAVIGRAALLLS